MEEYGHCLMQACEKQVRLASLTSQQFHVRAV